MITMIFGLETFKDLAAVPIIIVIITKTLQMDANAFAQFQFADPRDLLINFCILTNDSEKEIVSLKRKIWALSTNININENIRLKFMNGSLSLKC
jgi:hypothetical protein